MGQSNGHGVTLSSPASAGMTVPDDEDHLRALAAEGRVLLAFTPDQWLADWTCWGLD